MQNAKCRMLNVECAERTRASSFNILHFAFCILLFFATYSALANQLTVDKQSATLDDAITVTVVLDNPAFASLNTLKLPLQNLVMDGQPSVSSEFQWINGRFSRRKTFRYQLHGRAPGEALVGPLVVRSDDGQIDTLAPVAIQIVPDPSTATNDPLQMLHELLATGRDPVFLVASIDRTSVYVGEEVVVTWTIYNGAPVQQFSIRDVPKFDDFWSEELDLSGESVQSITLGGVAMQKLNVRRVALFPLRSGTLTIDGIAINAALLKRVNNGDPFGLFEGVLADVTRRSSRLTLDVKPLPPGPPVDVVGDVTLRCAPAHQRNGGPVVIGSELSGRANLRAANAPHFAQPIDGTTQLDAGTVSVTRQATEARMTRKWSYLVFPSKAGPMRVPPLVTDALTANGQRQSLRCEGTTLDVQPASIEGGASPLTPAAATSARLARLTWRDVWPFFALIALLLLALLFVPGLRRRAARRREVRALVRDRTPAEVREALASLLAARGLDTASLMAEASERGDAWRAVRSLLDALERDRLTEAADELEDRVAELLRATAVRDPR